MRLAFSYALPVLSSGESLYKKKTDWEPSNTEKTTGKIVIIIMYMYVKN